VDFAEAVDGAREAVFEWCREHSALPRIPLVLYMAWIGVRHLADTDYASWFAALNLGIHEGGHLLFGWQPWQFLTVAGGTLLQLAAPLASAWMFCRQPDYFAVAVCGGWLSTNLYGIATYAADAQELDLPLVNVDGGEADHDWAYMLEAVGLIEWDHTLAFLIRVVAFAVMWSSVAAAVAMLRLMARRGMND
jgi:hypothetical protein